MSRSRSPHVRGRLSGGVRGGPQTFDWNEGNGRVQDEELEIEVDEDEVNLDDVAPPHFSPPPVQNQGVFDDDWAVSKPDEYVMSEKNRAGAAKAAIAGARVEKQHTLKGVFFPCVQNIMGVILFIRLPYITGQAGIFMTMLIIFLCKFTTCMTTLSMSAIATNGTVQAGGPYYIISRNLGVEIGGAIGTLFYLGTTIAASMYVLGAVETIASTFGIGTWGFSHQILALMLMAVLASIVGVGPKYVTASSMFFLGVVFFSIVSIILGILLFAGGVYSGGLNDVDRVFVDNVQPNFTEDPDTHITPTFFSLLALFFPSATGIMAGCNRSAVLATPGKSIPKGTLWAIAFTTGLYLVFNTLFGLIIRHQTLVNDKLVAAKVAWPTYYLVSLGIVFSSFGAGMQCLVGASRLLAAIANDRTIPFLMSFAPLPDKEPTRAVWLTWALASVPCLAGNLDYITPVITMFFLLMYGAINMSCFVLSILQSPGFRPQWRYYSWYTALAGFLMCVALMLVISWKVAVISIFLAFGLLFYIKYQNATRDWGDTLVGFRFQLARDMLLSLSYTEMHPKNWRPQLLVFCKADDKGNPTVPELLSLAGQMKMGRGLLMAVALLPGDIVEDSPKAVEAQRVLTMHLMEEGIEGFGKVSICHDVVQSAVTVMHHSGIGSMQPNSVLFGWPEDWSKNYEKGTRFVSMLRGAVNAKKAVMVLKGSKKVPSGFDVLRRGDTIDIWWVAHDGGLLLLIPYLLTLHRTWKRCSIRLFSVVTDRQDTPGQVEHDVREYLEQVRINASVQAVDLTDESLNDELYQQALDDRAQQDRSANLGLRAVTAHSAHTNNINSIIEGGAYDEPEELESADSAGSGKLKGRNGVGGGSGGIGAAGAYGGESGGTESPDRIQRMQAQAQGAMRTAFLLNRSMLQHSSKAKLVVTNLPLKNEMNATDILGYIEAISEGMAPVLMIRGTGQEVVTTYG